MRSFCSIVLLLLALLLQQARAATLVYHQPAAVLYHHPLPVSAGIAAAPGEEQVHPGYTLVAPLTKIAHVTYDSVPIPHTPLDHVPLFQRIGHVKTVRI